MNVFPVDHMPDFIMKLHGLTVNLFRTFFQGRNGKLVTYSCVLLDLSFERIVTYFGSIAKYVFLDIGGFLNKEDDMVSLGPLFHMATLSYMGSLQKEGLLKVHLSSPPLLFSTSCLFCYQVNSVVLISPMCFIHGFLPACIIEMRLFTLVIFKSFQSTNQSIITWVSSLC